MKRRMFWRQALLLAACLGGIVWCSGAAAKGSQSLIGQPFLNFSLPSSQDRLITYGNEFYGKHYLIITFFPAAFTPV